VRNRDSVFAILRLRHGLASTRIGGGELMRRRYFAALLSPFALHRMQEKSSIRVAAPETVVLASGCGAVDDIRDRRRHSGAGTRLQY
jgi:hypothetical protein